MKKSRKILALIAGITFLVPTVLTTVACDEKKIDNTGSVIDAINHIETLKINISDAETNETTFEVLNNVDLGLKPAISKHDIVNFDQKLFQLDTEHVYSDVEKNNKVTETDQIKLTTYYFNFTYAKKMNYATIPVTITNREKEVTDAINDTTYDLVVIVNSLSETLKEKINFDFIKKSLDEDVQNVFDDCLFELNSVTSKGKEIMDDDLVENQIGIINAEINYNYGTAINQSTSLKIIKNLPTITRGEFIKISEERSANDPMVFKVKTKKPGNYDYLPIVLEEMRVAIYEEFINVYKLRVDISKLKMTDIQSDEVSPVHFDDDWFIDTKRFNALGTATYDGLTTGPIHIIFDVVQR